jgi:hypothetical protein
LIVSLQPSLLSFVRPFVPFLVVYRYLIHNIISHLVDNGNVGSESSFSDRIRHCANNDACNPCIIEYAVWKTRFHASLYELSCSSDIRKLVWGNTFNDTGSF